MAKLLASALYFSIALYSASCSQWTREETCRSLQMFLSEAKAEKIANPFDHSLDSIVDAYKIAMKENKCVEDSSWDYHFQSFNRP